MYRERREREEALADLRKQAEEKKAHAERVERRVSGFLGIYLHQAIVHPTG